MPATRAATMHYIEVNILLLKLSDRKTAAKSFKRAAKSFKHAAMRGARMALRQVESLAKSSDFRYCFCKF